MVKCENVSTKVSLSGWELDNPVIPASGTFGFGYEFAEIYDINKLGSFSFKGTTVSERFGNETPRIAEAPMGIINSVGLQNPGIDKVISEELPKLKKVYDYVAACRKIDNEDIVGLIEVNISCPNVHSGGMSFGTTCENAAKITEEVKKVVSKPVFIKLTPNVTDIASIAKACENAGADGLSLINTLVGMRINLKTGKPVLKNKTGGLADVYKVYDAVKIPIIGMGGVSSAEDVIEMMMAGATAVEVGAYNLVNPYASSEIVDNLPSAMEKYHIKNIKDIIGVAHNG